MAGAFGFAKYPQKKSPAAQDVGAALMEQQQMSAPAVMPYGPGQMAPPPTAMGPGQMAPMDPDAMMRAEGALKMTGPGQSDDSAIGDGDGHSPNALSIAVGEAMTRAGGGFTSNPNPFKPKARSFQTLQQLGLSAQEATLLLQNGGV